MNTLALVTSDRDLLAVLADICEAPIRRFGTVDSAVDFSESRCTWPLVAVGPDAAATFVGERPPGFFVVLHTQASRTSTEPLLARQADAIWELPAEADWLLDRLGVEPGAMAEVDDYLEGWPS